MTAHIQLAYDLFLLNQIILHLTLKKREKRKKYKETNKKTIKNKYLSLQFWSVCVIIAPVSCSSSSAEAQKKKERKKLICFRDELSASAFFGRKNAEE